MQLTTEQIKQLIKEEIKKVLLKENSYEANLQKWNQKSSMEPKAWEQESDEYFDILQMGRYEEFMLVAQDDLAVFAYILSRHQELGREETLFLGSLGRNGEMGDVANVVKDYIEKDLERLIYKFANIYDTNKNKYSRTAIERIQEVISIFDQNRILAGYLGVEAAVGRRMLRASDDFELIIDDEFTDPKESIKMIRNIWHVDESGSPVDQWKSGLNFLAKKDLLFSRVNYPAYKTSQAKTSEVKKNNILGLYFSEVLPVDQDK